MKQKNKTCTTTAWCYGTIFHCSNPYILCQKPTFFLLLLNCGSMKCPFFLLCTLVGNYTAELKVCNVQFFTNYIQE